MAEKYGITNTVSLPVFPEIAALSDEGKVYEAPETALDEIAALYERL